MGVAWKMGFGGKKKKICSQVDQLEVTTTVHMGDGECFGFRVMVGIGVGSLVAQMVKNLAVMQETQVQSLGWKDPLEEEMATHPTILTWRIP